MKKQKIALVYDWVDKWGGVERLLLELHRIYPAAPLYTSFYNPKTAPWARSIKIKTSFMQNLPDFVKKSRVLSLLFFPFAFLSFDLSRYDTIISVSSAFAKGVKTTPNQKHISIILTPPRYLWSHQNDYLNNSIKYLFEQCLNILKWCDFKIAQKPDVLFSISDRVRHRVKKYYRRDSEVLYPPFDTAYWSQIKKQISTKKFRPGFYFIPKNEYYLVVSRLETYKKIDLVLQLFKQLKQPLIVVGSGTQENKLKQFVKKNKMNNILFLKNVTDADVAYLYTYARALTMPQEEDFGYTSLEAQFFGCPVISFKNSGAAETIINGKSGILFDKQSIKSLSNAIERSKSIPYNDRHESDYLRGRSWHKTVATFKKKITEAVRKNHR
ncbi:MAG: glycosyltransferase [Microgenomates group bacterium]|jgi:glycosyltransferase involved in cell wall biosynthesis|nr:glycosyltransferase [Candidatus Woesebacteria bacterium]